MNKEALDLRGLCFVDVTAEFLRIELRRYDDRCRIWNDDLFSGGFSNSRSQSSTDAIGDNVLCRRLLLLELKVVKLLQECLPFQGRLLDLQGMFKLRNTLGDHDISKFFSDIGQVLIFECPRFRLYRLDYG